MLPFVSLGLCFVAQCLVAGQLCNERLGPESPEDPIRLAVGRFHSACREGSRARRGNTDISHLNLVRYSGRHIEHLAGRSRVGLVGHQRSGAPTTCPYRCRRSEARNPLWWRSAGSKGSSDSRGAP